MFNRLKIKFLFLFIVIFCCLLSAQNGDISQFQLKVSELQLKMHEIDTSIVARNFANNPGADIVVENPELIPILMEKGDVLWAQYKTKRGIKVLTQSFRAYKSVINGMEAIAKSNPSNKMLTLISENNIRAFEGAIHTSLIGYNMTQGLSMFSETFVLVDRHHQLNDFLEAPKTFKMVEKNEMPGLKKCFESLDGKREAIVEYFVGNNMIFALIIWNNGAKQLQVSNKEKVINDIQQLRNILKTTPGDEDKIQNHTDFAEAAFNLNQSLLNHPLTVIPDSIKSIVIVPHGALKAVPFELLLRTKSADGNNSFSVEDQDYVLENYLIRYADSYRDLTESKVSMSLSDEAIKEKLNDKLKLLNDPSKTHPSQWTALFPKGMADVDLSGKSVVKENDTPKRGGGGIWPILIGLMLAVGLIFGYRKMKNKA